ncbi:uncharacterized protein [Macrobrachium rosenbergii]|uniref:uncharacterized protein n=1 Tax=Macrobrachium rosenbergii TaxID=79674 RepID=UPI0034D6AEBC
MGPATPQPPGKVSSPRPFPPSEPHETLASTHSCQCPSGPDKGMGPATPPPSGEVSSSRPFLPSEPQKTSDPLTAVSGPQPQTMAQDQQLNHHQVRSPAPGPSHHLNLTIQHPLTAVSVPWAQIRAWDQQPHHHQVRSPAPGPSHHLNLRRHRHPLTAASDPWVQIRA